MFGSLRASQDGLNGADYIKFKLPFKIKSVRAITSAMEQPLQLQYLQYLISVFTHELNSH